MISIMRVFTFFPGYNVMRIYKVMLFHCFFMYHTVCNLIDNKSVIVWIKFGLVCVFS